MKNFFSHFKNNSNRTNILLILAIIFVVFYFYNCAIEKVCMLPAVDKFVRKDVVIIFPKGAVEAEVVNTDKSRELGLSGREKMGDGEGMLFIFDHEGKYGFWMKDMNFPLDILWINQEGIVVHIERNISEKSYPKTFSNEIDAMYVLELNAKSSDRLGAFLGSKVIIKN